MCERERVVGILIFSLSQHEFENLRLSEVNIQYLSVELLLLFILLKAYEWDENIHDIAQFFEALIRSVREPKVPFAELKTHISHLPFCEIATFEVGGFLVKIIVKV